MVRKLFTLDDSVAKALNTIQKDIVERALDFYFDYTDSIIGDKIIEDTENKKIKTYSKEESYKLLDIE